MKVSTSISKPSRNHIRLEKRSAFLLPTRAEFLELWEFRELIVVIARRDVNSRYRQAALGGLWAILQPLLNVIFLSFFLGRLAHMPSDGVPYFIFCLSGMILWQYFASTISSAMQSLLAATSLIKKVYFPRIILPISAALPHLVDLGVNLLVTFLAALVYQYNPTTNLLWLPLFVLLAILTAFGAVCWFQSLSILFHDVRHLMPLAMQLWLICSPIMYPVSIVPESHRLYYWINPMATAVAGARWCLLGSGERPSEAQLISVFTAIVFAASGAMFYVRTSKWFADIS